MRRYSLLPLAIALLSTSGASPLPGPAESASSTRPASTPQPSTSKTADHKDDGWRDAVRYVFIVVLFVLLIMANSYFVHYWCLGRRISAWRRRHSTTQQQVEDIPINLDRPSEAAATSRRQRLFGGGLGRTDSGRSIRTLPAYTKEAGSEEVELVQQYPPGHNGTVPADIDAVVDGSRAPLLPGSQGIGPSDGSGPPGPSELPTVGEQNQDRRDGNSDEAPQYTPREELRDATQNHNSLDRPSEPAEGGLQTSRLKKWGFPSWKLNTPSAQPPGHPDPPLRY